MGQLIVLVLGLGGSQVGSLLALFLIVTAQMSSPALPWLAYHAIAWGKASSTVLHRQGPGPSLVIVDCCKGHLSCSHTLGTGSPATNRVSSSMLLRWGAGPALLCAAADVGQGSFSPSSVRAPGSALMSTTGSQGWREGESFSHPCHRIAEGELNNSLVDLSWI